MRKSEALELAAITAVVGVGILSVAVFIDSLKVDRQPFYSLIVKDAHGVDWVVDYNLTRNDCVGQLASPSASCARQPDGKLP